MNLAEKYIEKQISSLMKIKDIPDFRPGDVVKVHNKIVDEKLYTVLISGFVSRFQLPL